MRVAEQLLLSPLFETMLLIALIELCRWFRLPPSFQIFISATILCLMHSVSWLPWGLIVAPVFAICAFSYLHWRSTSRRLALGVAILIHVLHNFIPAVGVISHAIRNA